MASDNDSESVSMVKKRSEQEWRDLIDNFESYGHQNPTVFCVAHNVHVHDLKHKQMELKTNRFIPVLVTDDQTLEPIARLQLPSGAKLDILSLPALVHLVNAVTT